MSPTGSTNSNPVTTPTSSTTPMTTSPNDPLANESTFLTLLVSQLQNQDPLNPVDSTTFVSQLTSLQPTRAVNGNQQEHHHACIRFYRHDAGLRLKHHHKFDDGSLTHATFLFDFIIRTELGFQRN